MKQSNIWAPLETPDSSLTEIQKASGTRVFDVRGKEYLDMNSGLWNRPFGYGDEAIKEALKEQLDDVAYVNPCEFTTKAAEELADKLLELLHPDMEKILYTCSGSESADLTVKLIRKYASLGGTPERNVIAVVKNSYHGSYYGSMSISNYCSEARNGYAPLLPEIVELSLPFSEVEKIDIEDAKNVLEKELEACGKRLGGIILEPVLGSAGVIPLPDWFVNRLLEFANEKGVIVAFDEVATGFGRTGDVFRYEHFNAKPDIVTMSKALNNGILPLGAVAVSKRIVDRFRKNEELIFHLSTQNANALACRAGLEVVNRFSSDKSDLMKINAISKKIRAALDEVLEKYSRVFCVRQCGMMFSMELLDQENNQMSETDILKVVRLLKRNGILVEWSYLKDVSSCIVMMPMYIMSDEDIDKMKDGLDKTFARLFK